MKKWFLALGMLLAGSVSLALGDYVIIGANLGTKVKPAKDAKTPGKPAPPPKPPKGDEENTEDKGEIDPHALVITTTIEVEHVDKIAEKKFHLGGGNLLPLHIRHAWGSSDLKEIAAFGPPKVVHLDSVHKRLEKKLETLGRNKPTAEEYLPVAEWALEHDLLAKFVELMDKLAAADPANPTVVAYKKVKAELDRPVTKQDQADNLTRRLSGYQVESSPHYALIHNLPAGSQEVKLRLDLLEDTMKGFYFWFALRNVTDLAFPQEKVPAVLTSEEKDFKKVHQAFSSGSLVYDGFLARREGLAFFSSKRLDEPYEALKLYAATLAEKGIDRNKIFKPGYKFPLTVNAQVDPYKAHAAYLLLKSMEVDSERCTVTHGAARQLVFASGLLPRGVAAPEWVQFGLGSFFETAPRAPWPSLGAPSSMYLPIYQLLDKSGKLGRDPSEALLKVVRDDYFRVPLNSKNKEHVLNEARATSWALTFFLAQKKLPELRRFCAELARMPRDLDLDGDVLEHAFALAFDALDANGKINKEKITALANQWHDFMAITPLEMQEIMVALVKMTEELRVKKVTTDPRRPGGPPDEGGGGGAP